jgi:hypothetical protein
MKELGITKGEWKQSHRKIPNDPEGMYSTQVYDRNGKTIATLAWYSVQKGNVITTTREANAILIADAGTTANKCGMLPSELLERYNEAIEVLEEIKKVIKHHPHHIVDENRNKWKVVEVSDIEAELEQTISKSK